MVSAASIAVGRLVLVFDDGSIAHVVVLSKELPMCTG